jgi:DNA-binding transcriptional regulator YiaG
MTNPKKARLRLGLSQSEMAAACDTHPMTISKWETGERTPRRPAARLIETLLWLKSTGMLDAYLEYF